MANLKSGDNATIKFKISSIKVEELVCAIKRVEQDRICLKFPVEKQELADFLPEGKELNVVVYSMNGIHIFDSIVINSPLEEEFIVEFYDDDLDTIQRREFVRIPAEMKLVIKDDKGTEFETKTIDISGGGVKFWANNQLAIAQEVQFTLFVPNSSAPTSGNGIIINKKNVSDDAHAIMKFTSIRENQRSKIIKYCFEQEAFSRRTF